MKQRGGGTPATIGWLAPILAMLIVGAIVAAGLGLPQLMPQSDVVAATMITIDDVNLRAGPGTEYDVLAVLPLGTTVSLHADATSAFASVVVNGTNGWVAKQYLADPSTFIAQSVAAEPTAESVSLPTAPPTLEPTAPPPPAEPTPEPTAPPPAEPTSEPVQAQNVAVEAAPQPGEHWIEVNRTTRTVTLHNGEIIVAQFDALIGKDPSADGYYSTAIGTFRVHVMEKNLAETPFADDVYLTDFVGFDPVRSNGFHSPVRDADGNVVVTGGTQTLGCVRLSEADAITLFDFAYIGMRVEVHD